MKYLLPTLAVLAGATTKVMATGWAQYVADWNEDGLRRWRYTYSSVSEDNWGQDFLWALRNSGGITNNWQAYDDEFGRHIFDVNEVSGVGTSIVVSR